MPFVTNDNYKRVLDLIENHWGSDDHQSEVLNALADGRASDGEIDAARSEHASDDIEIDDDASVSRADDGYWVSAWVWVAVESEEELEDE